MAEIVVTLITHEQAKESALRLLNSARANDGPRARFTIPVREDDDDILLLAYIAQQEYREMVRK